MAGIVCYQKHFLAYIVREPFSSRLLFAFFFTDFEHHQRRIYISMYFMKSMTVATYGPLSADNNYVCERRMRLDQRLIPISNSESKKVKAGIGTYHTKATCQLILLQKSKVNNDVFVHYVQLIM